jgi:hypothetical protein
MKTSFLIFYLLFSILRSRAQVAVPVSEEPRHHVVFANDKVRLLNVLLPPGDTTQYHLHSTPSVFIGFTKTHTASQLFNQEPTDGISSDGTIWFENLSPPHTRIHRVWNMDTATYHVMDIEILSKDSGFSANSLALPHIRQVIDTPWTRTYKVQLEKSERVNIKEHASAFVLVAMDDGMINLIKQGTEQNLSLQPGSFLWVKPSEELTLLSKSNSIMYFALVEIK